VGGVVRFLGWAALSRKQRKEKKDTILDIQTPNGGIKVAQDKESGAVDVKVEE